MDWTTIFELINPALFGVLEPWQKHLSGKRRATSG